MEESTMVMDQARPRLQRLSQVAVELNKATDLFMSELHLVERELAQLKLGLEVELERSIKESALKEEHDGCFYTAWKLGYGKDDRGEWHLLINEYKIQVTLDTRGEIDEERFFEVGATQLLRAPRDLRIAAAENLSDLIAEIEKTAQEKVAVLKKLSDRRE
jgi:hypothetical protein